MAVRQEYPGVRFQAQLVRRRVRGVCRMSENDCGCDAGVHMNERGCGSVRPEASGYCQDLAHPDPGQTRTLGRTAIGCY